MHSASDILALQDVIHTSRYEICEFSVSYQVFFFLLTSKLNTCIVHLVSNKLSAVIHVNYIVYS